MVVLSRKRIFGMDIRRRLTLHMDLVKEMRLVQPPLIVLNYGFNTVFLLPVNTMSALIKKFTPLEKSNL